MDDDYSTADAKVAIVPPMEARPDEADSEAHGMPRRTFLGVALTGGLPLVIGAQLDAQQPETTAQGPAFAWLGPNPVPVTLRVNGVDRTLAVEPRVTLLDALREHLSLTGTKKGCNHGECGACTVHVDGRRVNSCLTLALAVAGKSITTIEGVGRPDALHPMQQAFIDQDGFQCGYCTSGQIMSAIACVHEDHAGSSSEIREWMSGNICRCSAYPQIVLAVRQGAAATRALPALPTRG